MDFRAVGEASPGLGCKEHGFVSLLVDPLRHAHAFIHVRSMPPATFNRAPRRIGQELVVLPFVPFLQSSTKRDTGTHAAGSTLEPAE
jgi:hypothetical protein